MAQFTHKDKADGSRKYAIFYIGPGPDLERRKWVN